MTDLVSSRPLGVSVPTGGFNIRVVATGLLVVMAAVFVAAKYYQDVHPAVGFIRAFAEAAMVGGLADWFAVTALFRHPMGLPIPHTAIVPRNKNRIGDTLARFLLTNFLLPRLIARKMQTLDVAGAVGKFLSQPAEGGGRLKLGASRIIADALGALDQQRLGGMVKSAIADRLRELDDQPLLDAMVKWGSKTLELNEHLIHQMVHDNSNAIVRFTGLDESISNRIVAGLSKLLSEMAADETHPLRLRVEEGLAKMALDLQHDPEVKAKVAKVRDELLENKAVKRWLDGLWEQGRGALLKAARDPETMLAGQLGELITQFGAMLGEDAAIKRTLNRYARRAVVGMVDSYGETALKLVSDTIRGWDAKTITDRLENAVGDDLQYIRINGTLVGGLVGVAIHAVDIWI